MRALSLWSLALLVVMEIAEVPLSSGCGNEGLIGCPLGILAVLLGFIGLVLAFCTVIVGVVRTVKRRQWGWCVGLVVGLLVPPYAGFYLSVYNAWTRDNEVLRLLPLSAGFLLTPVVALIYSWRYPRRVAAEPSASLVPLPAAEPMGETTPPPLDAT